MSRQRSQAPAEVLLHRDLSTSQQINMLLPICHTMLSALLNPEREHENIPGQKLLAGEAFIAAENTFRKACERLSDIIDDSARWGVAYQLRLEQQYNERHTQQMALLKAQQEAAEQQKISAAVVVAPHFRYKPALIPLDDGKWVAFLGNVEDLESGILGVGSSPGAALKEFDAAFSRDNMTAEIKKWLAQHETDLERGVETTLPFPQNENSKSLESPGDRTPETPSGGGQNNSGDCPAS